MLLLYTSILLAALHWFFTARKSKMGIYLTKPPVMILLTAWVASSVWTDGTACFPLVWFILALLFCLAGDIFLMLPEKWFKIGLVFFLIGHVFYTIGFASTFSPERNMLGMISLAAVLVFSGNRVVRRLFSGLQALQQEDLKAPIFVYAGVISIMLFSAVSCIFDPQWPTGAAVITAAGAMLFYISDIMNAWHRFVKPLANGRVWIMSTYHLAQICLGVGVVLYLSI